MHAATSPGDSERLRRWSSFLSLAFASVSCITRLSFLSSGQGVRVDRADEGAEGFPTRSAAEEKEESRRHRRLHVVRSDAECARAHFVQEVDEMFRDLAVQERQLLGDGSCEKGVIEEQRASG